MYESLAVVEYNNQDYDKGMAYPEKIDKLGGKKEELSVYHGLEDMNKDSSEYDPLPGEVVQDNQSKKRNYMDFILI